MPALPSLIDPPIAFAHRGGCAHAPENTLEAFRLALRLGATGLESDVWLTSDGVPVLDHDGVVRARLRRHRIVALHRSALPPHIPSLQDLYATCGTDFELSLDIKDAVAAQAVVEVARAAGGDAERRLWLCHPSEQRVASWRRLSDQARLVHSTRLHHMRRGPERLAAQLAATGVDAVNLHYSDWTGGLTTLFHRFERYTFGWDAQHERILRELLRIGLDGVYSNWVDRMVEVLGTRGPRGA